MYAGQDTDEDIFIFSALTDSVNGINRDRIYQFDSGEDKLNFAALDANTSSSGNQAFAYSGSTADANSLWWLDSGSDILVRGDVTGDGVYDFEVQVMGINALVEDDFIL